jgi:hypothetical protein
MKTFHIITGKYLPMTEKKPARMSIHSARFNQRVIITSDDDVNKMVSEWLLKHGFNVIGTGFVSDWIVIVSDTFKPLKSVK